MSGHVHTYKKGSGFCSKCRKCKNCGSLLSQHGGPLQWAMVCLPAVRRTQGQAESMTSTPDNEGGETETNRFHWRCKVCKVVSMGGYETPEQAQDKSKRHKHQDIEIFDQEKAFLEMSQVRCKYHPCQNAIIRYAGELLCADCYEPNRHGLKGIVEGQKIG